MKKQILFGSKKKEAFQTELYETMKTRLLEDKEFISEFNQKLNSTIAVWGSRDRLHISENTSMVNTLFNTSSGTITVGEYTFTGHNVSIITGSHEVEQTGRNRMDRVHTDGNITIGSGVWICSNATILGPCTIGDNAVIAAGSVVLPHTVIQENALFAGIPAVMKKIIAIDEHGERDKTDV